MDLASVYRALVRKYFPRARIVADRFHVIRLVNHHFLACWRQIDPSGAKHRGLLSLMRRHRHNLKPVPGVARRQQPGSARFLSSGISMIVGCGRGTAYNTGNTAISSVRSRLSKPARCTMQPNN